MRSGPRALALVTILIIASTLAFHAVDARAQDYEDLPVDSPKDAPTAPAAKSAPLHGAPEYSVDIPTGEPPTGDENGNPVPAKSKTAPARAAKSGAKEAYPAMSAAPVTSPGTSTGTTGPAAATPENIAPAAPPPPLVNSNSKQPYIDSLLSGLPPATASSAGYTERIRSQLKPSSDSPVTPTD